MRLRRLELTRYGLFTDHVIDLGERRDGEPDLHIVYGPNEAGKSTTISAFLDLLFGIGMQSRYNFLHPYPSMRIGATLELANGEQQFVRIKRPQRSLLGQDNQPLSEALIQGELGNLDRAAYRAMFCLDDETLESGGDDILQSKGDVGRLLFAATAGLSDLSRVLEQVRQEADGFYRFHARSGELATLKAELANLKETREKIDTLASDYARLVGARDTAARLYEESLQQIGATERDAAAIGRKLSALPRISELNDLRAQADELSGLPEAPLAWPTELPELEQAETVLAVSLDGAHTAVDQALGRLTDVVRDDAAENLSGELAWLEQMSARTLTAELDLPNCRRKCDAADAQIATILRRLDRDGEVEPGRLIIKARPLANLKGLISAKPKIDADVHAANTEYQRATQQLSAAQQELQLAGEGRASAAGTPAEISALMAALEVARASDPRMALRRATDVVTGASEKLQQRLAALRPWHGAAAVLAELPVVDTDRLDGWKAALDRLDGDILRLDAEIERHVAEQVRLQAELKAIQSLVGVVSDEEALRVRADREVAWAEHRGTLDLATADAFDAVMRRDDQVSAARLGHQTDVARLHATASSLAVVQAELGRAQQQKQTAERKRTEEQAQLGAAARAMSGHFSGNVTVSEVKAWLQHRAEALDAWEVLHEAEAAKLRLDADATANRARLLSALHVVRIVPAAAADWDMLLSAAQEAVELERQLKARRDAVSDRIRDSEARRLALHAARTSEKIWLTEWAEACAACWLGEGETLPTANEMVEILGILGELAPLVQSREDLIERIANMERDQAEFAARIAQLSDELAISDPALSSSERAKLVERRIRDSGRLRAEHEKAQSELAKAETRRSDLIEKHRIHQNRKEVMTALFGVATLREVDEKLRQLQRRASLLDDLRKCESDLLSTLGSATIEEVRTLLAGVENGELEQEMATLKARLTDLQGRARELFAEHSKAVDQVELVGGDGEVARLEEQRRGVALQIEDRAMTYLRLRAGVAAAESALRMYRDRHRSGMMARASDAFSSISRGRYRGLSTRPEKDGEVLIAVGAEGGSKVASDLSKGTRFQLYLALRAAGYHEFVTSRPAVPFIADDIMETFDDFRAEETFRLFGDMAQVGQIVYLTHHRHLCNIAKQVIPGAHVHELPSL